MPEQKFLGAFRVICPSCNRDIYYEKWEGKPDVTQALRCPWCGGPLGVTGTVDSLAVVEADKVVCVSPERHREYPHEEICEKFAPTEGEVSLPLQVGKLTEAITNPEWWKKHGVWVGIGVVSIILIITLVKK